MHDTYTPETVRTRCTISLELAYRVHHIDLCYAQDTAHAASLLSGPSTVRYRTVQYSTGQYSTAILDAFDFHVEFSSEANREA